MTGAGESTYEVVVIGGGAAGLSGAIALARSRRAVAVIDSGQPRNAPAAGVHVLLGHDGIAPTELLERGRAELHGFGGVVLTGEVETVRREGADFALTLADGRIVRARRLLVASGIVDELPAIPGLREQWGRHVLHCPYCHGWEVRDRRIGIIGTSPMSVHQALLFSRLSADVLYFAHEAPPTAEQAAQLAVCGVRVVEGAVAAVESEGDRLTGVRLADGTVVARDAVAVSTRVVARAGFLEGVGLRPVDHFSGMGVHIPADPMGRTEVPGIWVAGNVAEPMAQVGAAAAAGVMAGAQINYDLLHADIESALSPTAAIAEH